VQWNLDEKLRRLGLANSGVTEEALPRIYVVREPGQGGDTFVPGGAKHREAATAFAEALLYPLWDAGLSVGHQVMDPAEAVDLAQEDLATATSLLDLRHLAGDRACTTELLDRAWSGIFSEGELAGFVERLEEEATARHARFGASVYLLEPDVKSGAGGLRDLDGARWAARARFKVAGTELEVSGVQELGKKLKEKWTKPEPRTVDEIEADFKAQYQKLKAEHPKAVMATLPVCWPRP
jgi:UTP:GlnB (protein PII) uridylyltransferase